MARGGIFKEKKRQKKGKGDKGSSSFSNAPIFTLPEIISKKKKEK